MSPAPGGTADSRLKDVTILHLLQHLGGWDRGKSFDPMFEDRRISEELQVKLPIDTSHIIKFMNGQKLQHEPGTVYAYSNYGYCILGRVIEKCTGMEYDQYVKQEILKHIEKFDTPGQRLPSEREWCDLFQVSRSTIRQSLQSLELEGEIQRKRGSGWYVSAPPLRFDPTGYFIFSY